MLKKQYNKARDEAKVTFYLGKEVRAESVTLVGDFNDWDETSHPMERLKDGRFKVTLALPAGRDYQFRYLVNRTEWHNDDAADDYVANPHGSDNSVVSV